MSCRFRMEESQGGDSAVIASFRRVPLAQDDGRRRWDHQERFGDQVYAADVRGPWIFAAGLQKVSEAEAEESID